ncbi:MAG: glycosyltransferase [Clostridia bacterium]|nr:glycosyltransferase [Clostridia bacterium]
MKKKRVAHIINSKIYSGLEKVVIRIMQNMGKEYEMVYVTQDGPIVDILKKNNIPYYIIKDMSRKEIKAFVKSWKPDIIQAHDYTASVVCSLSKGKIPLLLHIHNNSLWIKKVCVNTIAFLYAGIKADKILTVSESIEKEYVFSRFLRKKFVNVDNPVSCSYITKNIPNNVEKIYDICCVGRLTEAKDPDRFVEIIAKCCEKRPQLKAIWVGEGECREQLEENIAKHKLENNILLLGYKENPYEYMAMSKIFVLTSKWEGYGLVAFEALAAGLPCFVSNVGGLPKIVDDSSGKVCETNGDFQREIEKILTDESLYIRKKNGAIQRAKKIENEPEYMKTLNDMYLKLL